jgi:hypothetical protein
MRTTTLTLDASALKRHAALLKLQVSQESRLESARTLCGTTPVHEIRETAFATVRECLVSLALLETYLAECFTVLSARHHGRA